MAAEITAASPSLSVSISRMTEHDLLEVVEIEELSGLSPWGWDAYHKELQSPEDVVMLVARVDVTLHEGKQVAGFIVSRIGAEEMHVNNVAVRPEFRRQGVAQRLLRDVLDYGKRTGARDVFLEVRTGNVTAQRLYRSCGFEITGRRRRYYNNPVEDALLMSVSL